MILNGSFELPAIPANSYENTTPPTYWSLSGGQFAFLDNGNVTGVLQPGATWPLPEDGQQFVDIGNEPTLVSRFYCNESGDLYTELVRQHGTNRWTARVSLHRDGYQYRNSSDCDEHES
ncbi:hypothetical protein SBV1_1640022 [Verrucomicrobia bacterium]|nr:hypothetical protein SBV1_1640022 [Verrucomicrobiota bacterium]